jgi:hypothetical protein
MIFTACPYADWATAKRMKKTTHSDDRQEKRVASRFNKTLCVMFSLNP